METNVVEIIDEQIKIIKKDANLLPQNKVYKIEALEELRTIVSRIELPVGMPSENSFGQWIDVKDKLPEDANPVLIKLTNNPIMYGNMHTYLGDRYWLIWRSNGTYKENSTYRVTHWMPLPKL